VPLRGYSVAGRSAAPNSTAGSATAPNSAAGASALGEVPGAGGQFSGSASSQAGTVAVPTSSAPGADPAPTSAAGASIGLGANLPTPAPGWKWLMIHTVPTGVGYILVPA